MAQKLLVKFSEYNVWYSKIKLSNGGVHMKLGLFFQPVHPPERSLYDATEWNLEIIKEGDKLGYEEAWIGEHFTLQWEPIPSPDLLIAQAIKETKNIKLAPGAHLLPFHHPVELAHRIAYLDHLAQGRLMLGVGAGSVLTDFKLFGIDPTTGIQGEMFVEALNIMLKLWKEDGPFEYKGKFWTVNQSEVSAGGLLGPHIKPFQKPHPPIGITGLSKNSETLKKASQFGFLPLSFGYSKDTLVSHWKMIEEGAVISGKKANREEWHIAKDVFVADTDEEAYEHALGGAIGRVYRELQIPLFKHQNILSKFKTDPNQSDDSVTPEYFVKEAGLVGSPDTVARKLDELYDHLGGFGTLLVTCYDYADNPEVWKKSLKLLAEEVVPRLKKNRKQYFPTT